MFLLLSMLGGEDSKVGTGGKYRREGGRCRHGREADRNVDEERDKQGNKTGNR